MQEWLVSMPARLDSFLGDEGRMLSRAKAQKAIDDGRVSVNGDVSTKSSLRLQEGDKVSLEEAEVLEVSAVEAVDLHFTILYEDDACAVINKPAGIAVHPGAGMVPGEKTILNGIAFLYEQWGLPAAGRMPALDSTLVHRLDKETTGCLLIAKNPAAHLFLQQQFENRTVDKRYLALVAGIPPSPDAIIDSPIGRSTSDRTMMGVRAVSGSREAQTTYRTLATSPENRIALLECELHTGRTHQIRVHLSSIGHPVLGDGTYRSELSERIRADHRIESVCLHSWKLRFQSPEDKKDHQVVAPLPQEFQEILKRVGINIRL